MKLHDIEDADQIVTKDYLDARLERLEKEVLKQIIASERVTRGRLIALMLGAYGGILGTYALVIAAVYVNHFWH